MPGPGGHTEGAAAAEQRVGRRFSPLITAAAPGSSRHVRPPEDRGHRARDGPHAEEQGASGDARRARPPLRPPTRRRPPPPRLTRPPLHPPAQATAGHLGGLKAKLAKLRRELIDGPAGGGGGGQKGDGFEVNKVGDARVGLVGFPSVGKSTLLNKLTGTFSAVASYEFTTLTCVPGIIRFRGARIQLLDLPGIIEGAKDGKGRGRQVIATARTCSLIVIVLDALKPMTHKRLIEKELEGFGLRLNKEPPNITFKKKDKGGINFTSTVTEPKLDLDAVKAVLSEYRVCNADVHLRGDYDVDDLVDVIEGSRIYVPAVYAVNKIDQITLEELNVMQRLPHYCPVCAYHEWNLDGLVEMVRWLGCWVVAEVAGWCCRSGRLRL